MNHFIDEMNKNAIIFWATGAQNEWTVSFVDKPSNTECYREFISTIKVTEEKLYLTNYEDLTMSAQFEDTTIPATHHAQLTIALENGTYELTVRQMFDPEDYEIKEETDFEIVVQKSEKEIATIDKIYWWK